jgi:hypothetical protein
MTTLELEKNPKAGAKGDYQIVYRKRTYEDGEVETQSCILLPETHPLFGVEIKANKVGAVSFPLPLVMVGHGLNGFGVTAKNSWWIILGDRARIKSEKKVLSLEEIKDFAIPQILKSLEEAENPKMN